MQKHLRNIPLLLLLCLLWACGGDRALQSALDRAEALMEIQPDSALALLRPYDTIPDGSEEQRARFALLYAMALDKNYVDTADIRVLQPALDYYPTHGTDADKLRTLYYAGVIYQNADSIGKAMEAWADALQYRGPQTDSLTLARLLVNQGNEYYRLYQFQKFVDNQRQAEKIYRAVGKKDFADKAFLNQFELWLNLDSISAKKNIGRVDRLAIDSLSQNAELARSLCLQYEMHFGSMESLDSRLRTYDGLPVDSLDLTQILLTLGKTDEAENVFRTTSPDKDTQIKYLLRKMRIAKAKRNFEDALASSEEALHAFDIKQSAIIHGDRQFAEERSQWRHKVEEHQHSEENAWTFGIIGILAVMLIAGFIFYRVRIRNLKKEKQLNDLISEHTQKITVLENEKASLSGLLKRPTELPLAIRERLALLDSLIKDSWSDSLKSQKASRGVFLNNMTADPDFLINNGRVLEATYPVEAAALKEKGLTDEELGYLSIYLMGFSGKEIGIILKSKVYYKKSSIIRKKLGLDSKDKNLGLVVKQIFGVSSNGED